MRYALIVLAVVLSSWVVAQDGSPGASNAPGAVVKQETGPTVAPSPRSRPQTAGPKTTPANAQAVIDACSNGEKVVRERTIVRNYRQIVVMPGKDEAARKMARSADRDAKGDYACGGDGRIARLLRDWHVASLGDVDAKIAVKNPAPAPATPPAPPAEGGKGMNTLLGVLGSLLVAGILTYIIWSLCLRGAETGGHRMFLRDPNHEPAGSAPAPQSVGRRRIVSETARGDYHSEYVVSEGTALAAELARARNTEAIMEMFTARAAASLVTTTTATPAPAPKPAEPCRIVVEVVHGEPPAKTTSPAGTEKPADKPAPKAKPATS